MFRRTIAVAVLVGTAATAAAADEPQPLRATALPGSVNLTFGTISPAEPGNQISSVTIDQGLTWWRRGPLFGVVYGSATLRNDTAGLSWNHGSTLGGGARLIWMSGSQVLQTSIGIAGEPASPGANPVPPSLTATVSYWRGWTGSHQRMPNTPGSSWATSGLITPREPGNWITAAAFDQGVQVWHYRRLNLVPFAAVSASTDRDGHDWNNRVSGEVGLKLTHSIRGGIVDVRVSDRHERRWQSQTYRTSPSVSVNLWLGWNPHLFQH